MTASAMTLGPVTFQGSEVPDKLPFGGEQSVIIHKLIGGARVVDAMGRHDRDLTWSGRFFGPGALTRARIVDALRIAGAAVPLAVDQLSYTVVIKAFEADFEQSWNVPYSCTCVIVTDNAAPGPVGAGSALDTQMAGDSNNAGFLVSQVQGIPDVALFGGSLQTQMTGITSLVSQVQSVVGSISGFAFAGLATLAPVSSAIVSALSSVNSLANTLGGAITVSGVGGAVGGAQNIAATILAQQSITSAAPLVSALSNTLTRMQSNTANIPTSGALIVTAGGSLYNMAVTAYGDATEWTTIAAANGLTDPVLSGIQTIVVPSAPSGLDGLFSL